METANCLLSFVIPVYNVQEYLEECVHSILSQMTPECEIILVDDGATDTSGAICDTFAADNVRVIHQENGGLAAARNSGLAAAQGTYVSFVDSDDRVSDGAVRALLDWIQGSSTDICFLQAIKFFPDGTSCPLGDDIASEGIRKKTKTEVLQYLSTRPKYPGSSCTKIYRREFLTAMQLTFPHDRRQSEDLGFVRDCILQAQTFDALDMPFYEYRQKRTGSITNSANIGSVTGVLQFVEESVEILTRNRVPIDDNARHFLSFVAYEYSICLYNSAGFPEKNEELWNRIKACRWVLSFGKSKKVKAIALISRIFGLSFTRILLKKVKH